MKGSDGRPWGFMPVFAVLKFICKFKVRFGFDFSLCDLLWLQCCIHMSNFCKDWSQIIFFSGWLYCTVWGGNFSPWLVHCDKMWNPETNFSHRKWHIGVARYRMFDETLRSSGPASPCVNHHIARKLWCISRTLLTLRFKHFCWFRHCQNKGESAPQKSINLFLNYAIRRIKKIVSPSCTGMLGEAGINHETPSASPT